MSLISAPKLLVYDTLPSVGDRPQKVVCTPLQQTPTAYIHSGHIHSLCVPTAPSPGSSTIWAKSPIACSDQTCGKPGEHLPWLEGLRLLGMWQHSGVPFPRSLEYSTSLISDLCMLPPEHPGQGALCSTCHAALLGKDSFVYHSQNLSAGPAGQDGSLEPGAKNLIFISVLVTHGLQGPWGSSQSHSRGGVCQTVTCSDPQLTMCPALTSCPHSDRRMHVLLTEQA